MEEQKTTRSSAGPWTVRLLLLLLSISLVLHLWTLWSLNRVRLLARAQVGELSRQIAQAQDEVLAFNLPVTSAVPVRASIPVQQQLTIPVSTTIRLREMVNVPISTPFGEQNLNFPVTVNVPVRAEVPITIDQTVAISTPVMIDMMIPIELSVSQTPFSLYLSNLERALAQLREDL